MAMLCKKLSCFLPFNASSSSSRHHHLLRFSSTASTQAQDPTPQPPLFILQYLIDSCGLPPDRAARASKHLPHIKSPSKPDSVIEFLKETGLDDAQIRDAIAKQPRLLLAKVEPTLKAKRRAMLELGFSESELPRLIHLCPGSLAYRDLKPNLEFWRAFYPTNELLFKAMKRNPYLLTTSMERLLPNLSLLRRHGLSDANIAKTVPKVPQILTGKIEWVEELIRRAEEMGVPCNSGMFHYALNCVSGRTHTTINSKIRLLETLGCSEAVIKSTTRSMPYLLTISEKKIKDNMDFLTNKAGCDPSYIISNPTLLHYSVERRLVPRHNVLQILKCKGLAGGASDFFAVMNVTEKKFLDKYVLPHKEKVPELHAAYIATCAGKVTSQSNF